MRRGESIHVDMVKDPTRVKSRFIGSFTKRQVVCYGIAALIGIPFYLLTKDVIGKETAALFMAMLMFPSIMASIYEKDGLPAEKYAARFVQWRFLRPMKRIYKKENRFERMERRKLMEMEVEALECKQQDFKRAKEERRRQKSGRTETGIKPVRKSRTRTAGKATSTGKAG